MSTCQRSDKMKTNLLVVFILTQFNRNKIICVWGPCLEKVSWIEEKRETGRLGNKNRLHNNGLNNLYSLKAC
jgi:hypothetical protein